MNNVIERAEWLAKRKDYITASDVAAILGYSPYATALDIYARKKTADELADSDAMLLGRCLEDGIARVYAAKTDREVDDLGGTLLTIHPDIPWLAATLDRVTWRGDEPAGAPGSPLEIKHAGAYKLGEWEDGAPLWVQIQLQIQIACRGSQWGAYCGVIGGAHIRLGDVDRSDEFIESTIPILDEFRRRLANDDPPPVTEPRHLEAVRRLYPLDTGTTVELDADAEALANEWERAKATIKEAEAVRDLAQAKLLAMVGPNTFGALPDGTLLTAKTTARAGYTRVVEPSTYRVLRRKKG